MGQREPQVKRIVLPYGKGTPNEVWVDLNVRPSINDYISVEGKEGMAYRMGLVARCVKAWNFQRGDKLLDVTVENLGELDPTDIIHLINALDEEAKKLNLSNEEKKSSSAT